MQDIQDIVIMLFGGILLGVLILRGGNLGNERKPGKRGKRAPDLNPGTVAGAAMRSSAGVPMAAPHTSAMSSMSAISADAAVARLAHAAAEAERGGAGPARLNQSA